MRILFDLNHPVDVNFFKFSMQKLREQGHYVHVIFRKRGKLENILRYELPGFPVTEFGVHMTGFSNKIISQLKRDYTLVPFLKKEKFDLVVCFGPTSALSAKYCSIPYLAFDDDFEYKIPFYHANWFSTRHIYPDFIKYSNSKVFKYHGFKELAYLHPDVLNLSDNVLKEYSLAENEYIFIREISNISLNYKDESTMLTGLVSEIVKLGYKIVLSVENKELSELFEKDCILLEEPVTDIYSLLFYSKMVITSGDTMAREAALLGVPIIYTGGRKMAMNKPLVDRGLMFEMDEINEIVMKLTKENYSNFKEKNSSLIRHEWENTTSVILHHINDFNINNSSL